jgi:hypothetical protein
MQIAYAHHLNSRWSGRTAKQPRLHQLESMLVRQMRPGLAHDKGVFTAP